MILTVDQVEQLQGTVHLPASKSYSIRAFIIAAAGGISRIINPSDCDDAKVAISVARQLGARVEQVGDNIWSVRANKSKVSGLSGKTNFRKINVKESGTVLRFLLPLVSLYPGKAQIIGEGTLRGRPNYHLTSVLRANGVDIRGKGPKEGVPINLSGGNLCGGQIEIDGTLSSQFISALLIACPQLDEDSKLVIKGKQLVSSDYIIMTQQVLRKTGIEIDKINQRLYMIPGGQKFKGLKNFAVPSDYGLAAFLLAAGALVKSKVILKGHLGDDLIQADGKILDFLTRMGVKYKKTTKSLQLTGPSQLKGGSFSLKDCPDLVPIMSILALFAKGKTRLYDIKHARAKESDRISDLRNELLKIGAKVTEKENELTIHPYSPGSNQSLDKKKILLDPHRDHRLAMAFCVLGLKVGVRVKDIECVSKSYPGFLKDFKTIGAKLALP